MIVQKFGGTALKDVSSREQCYLHIENGLSTHEKVVVVVSAMGRFGDPYATDTLTSLTPSLKMNTEYWDLIACCGEFISVAIVVSELIERGIRCGMLYGKNVGIFTNEQFGNADIISISNETIDSYFQQFDCLVVPGFTGSTINHKFTTLGRGGSDLTAVSIASNLHCPFVEYYKDVPGVYDEKMEIVYPHLTHEKLLDICSVPKAIIQKKAVEVAKNHHLTLHIKPYYSFADGTIVSESLT